MSNSFLNLGLQSIWSIVISFAIFIIFWTKSSAKKVLAPKPYRAAKTNVNIAKRTLKAVYKKIQKSLLKLNILRIKIFTFNPTRNLLRVLKTRIPIENKIPSMESTIKPINGLKIEITSLNELFSGKISWNFTIIIDTETMMEISHP